MIAKLGLVILMSAFMICAAKAFPAYRIPLVIIHCESIDMSPAVQLNGAFQEIDGRHGLGAMRFNIYPLNGPMNLLFSSSGSARNQDNAGDIYYQDSYPNPKMVQAQFMASGSSEIIIGQQKIYLNCAFTSPSISSPSCAQFACHQGH